MNTVKLLTSVVFHKCIDSLLIITYEGREGVYQKYPRTKINMGKPHYWSGKEIPIQGKIIVRTGKQAGSKYLDSRIDTGINSWIDSTYKHPLNKPAIQLSQPSN